MTAPAELTWTCEMGTECLMNVPPRPGQLQWSGSGLDTNQGFYCQECIGEYDIPIGEDAPFLADVLNAAK